MIPCLSFVHELNSIIARFFVDPEVCAAQANIPHAYNTFLKSNEISRQQWNYNVAVQCSNHNVECRIFQLDFDMAADKVKLR